MTSAATAGAAGSGSAHEKAVDRSSGAFTQTFERVKGTWSRRGLRADRPEVLCRSARPCGPQSLVEQLREPGEGFVDVKRETEAATGLERDESVEGGADDAGGVNRVVRLETVAA